MKIDERWSIDADQHCWTLYEHTPKVAKVASKTRAVGDAYTVTNATYHATLLQAFMYLLDKGCFSAKDVFEAMSAIETMGMSIHAAIQRLEECPRCRAKRAKR